MYGGIDQKKQKTMQVHVSISTFTQTFIYSKPMLSAAHDELSLF